MKNFKEYLLGLIYKIYITIVMIFNHIRFLIFGKKICNIKDIPIIINNYNRLEYLLKLIHSLESRGYYNIYIIDNNSTYKPLLEYYKKTPYKVFMLNKNIGYKALWSTPIFNKFKNSYYVYTDSDLEICEDCPDNFMEYFYKILLKYPFSHKVGFGLKIDDLPDSFKLKNKVIDWEKRFWINEKEKGVYIAEIDTTFALYRPYCYGGATRNKETYRIGHPYLMRHLPWYVDSFNLSEEDIYYINSISQSTHWTVQNKNNCK